MPWTSRDDLPDALKTATAAYTAAQMAVWLRVANACLARPGADEGACIAAAHTAAKEAANGASNAPILNAEIPADVPEWVMVLRTGAWLGHPNGPEVVTPASLVAAMDQFQRHYSAHRVGLAVDYHHQSVLALSGAVSRSPAAGWIAEMQLRANGDELWGRVEWNEEARGLIGRRELRYLSPVLLFGGKDRATGEPVALQIHSVALTNTPFLTDLEALNALATNGRGRSGRVESGPLAIEGDAMSILALMATALGKKLEEVASGLGLEPAVEEKALAEALMANAVRVKELEAAAAAPRPPISEPIANALGVAVGADETAVRAAIGKLRLNEEGLALRAMLGLPTDAGKEALLNAVKAVQDAQRRDEAQELVTNAVKDGKIAPALAEHLLAMAKHDMAAAQALVNGLGTMVGPAPKRAGDAAPAGDLTESEALVARQLGLTKERMIAGRV